MTDVAAYGEPDTSMTFEEFLCCLVLEASFNADLGLVGAPLRDEQTRLMWWMQAIGWF